MKERESWLFLSVFFKNTSFWIHAYLDTSVKYICVLMGENEDINGSEGVSFIGLNCSFFAMEQLWVHFSLRFHKLAPRMPQAVTKKEHHVVGASSAANLFTTQCQPEHAQTAVWSCTDNTLIHTRPSQQPMQQSRHTRLHWAGEWVRIEASAS